MNILMMTNTFTPHVGGVARSVEAFTAEYRRRGHRVMVVAPQFENMPEDETDVVRVPAIQHFNGSDFSVALRMPGSAVESMEQFEPDIIHSHHPFLIGGAAVRLAGKLSRPLVFTHHTMYEQYTHYVLEDSETLKKFAVNLSTNYANLCDQVFAPSESVASIILKRGVTIPVEIVPTGVEIDRFARGSGPGFRAIMDIPKDAFIVGHVGRLAPEKNIPFLAEAVAAFLKDNHRARFLVVGSGPSKKTIVDIFKTQGLEDRLHLTGTLNHPVLVSAYRAMDVFAFASKSETQGMVLAEAMTAGVPVVALEASGVREIVVDGHNGRLLTTETIHEYTSALQWLASREKETVKELSEAARDTASAYSMETTTDTALAQYEELRSKEIKPKEEGYELWTAAVNRLKAEWELLTSVASAATASLQE